MDEITQKDNAGAPACVRLCKSTTAWSDAYAGSSTTRLRSTILCTAMENQELADGRALPAQDRLMTKDYGGIGEQVFVLKGSVSSLQAGDAAIA